MKKILIVFTASLFVLACSHKSAPATSMDERQWKTSSATVTQDQYMEGRSVFIAHCNKCHQYRDPASHTVKQWTYWLNRMAPKAKLTEEEKMKVLNFVSVNAKQ